MQIRSFVKESFIDYSGKISSVVFSPKCNYKCPACHAKSLLKNGKNIDEKIFMDYLDSRKGWVEAVVICGGEPTIQHNLLPFIRKLKEKGLAVKLDTNGSNCQMLRELKKEDLIDYVAMDVKGPPQLYQNIIGKEFLDARENYDKAISIISQFPDYEFRTTIVPVIRNNGEISFMTSEEIGQTAKLISDCSLNKNSKYFLQPFVPRKGGLINLQLESFQETPKELLEQGKEEAIKYLPNTKIR